MLLSRYLINICATEISFSYLRYISRTFLLYFVVSFVVLVVQESIWCSIMFASDCCSLCSLFPKQKYFSYYSIFICIYCAILQSYCIIRLWVYCMKQCSFQTMKLQPFKLSKCKELHSKAFQSHQNLLEKQKCRSLFWFYLLYMDHSATHFATR